MKIHFDSASPRHRSLVGQVLGILIAGLLCWLHSGGDFHEIFSTIDIGFLVVLIFWAICWVLMVTWVPARGADRPGFPAMIALVPMVVGLGLAALAWAQVPAMADPETHCSLFLLGSFFSERLRFVGLLATGTMLWGCAPLFLDSEAGYRAKRAWWQIGLAAGLVVTAVVWTMLDPLIPSRSGVGGGAVRGLWVLFGVVLFFWVWLRYQSRASERPPRDLLIVWLAGLGLLFVGAAMIAYLRTCGYYQLAFGPETVLGDERSQTAVVLSSAMLRISPVIGLALLICSLMAWLHLSSSGRKLLIGGLLGVLALLAVGWGMEMNFRAQYKARCEISFPAEFDLPEAYPMEDLGSGPFLLIAEKTALLDGRTIPESPGIELALGTQGAEQALHLVLDKKVVAGRVFPFLQAAASRGWYRFRIVVRSVSGDPDVCARENRVYGVCPSNRLQAFGSLPFEISHLSEKRQPPKGLVANLIVSENLMELSFGGFVGSDQEVQSLQKVLADRDGSRDERGLVEALEKAKDAFPQSEMLLLLPEEALTVQDLTDLLSKIRSRGGRELFPRVVISSLVR